MSQDQKRQFLQETNFQEIDEAEDTQEVKRKRTILNKYPQWNQENQQNN